MSNLTNNTAELRSILSAVNNLPAAGSGGITPTGTIQITENGTHDVTNYASAEVNVPTGGGSSGAELAIIQRTVTEYSNSELTKIGAYAFANCGSLTSISLPNVTTMGQYALSECGKLTSVTFPALEEVPDSLHRRNLALEKADFHAITNIARYGFYQCTHLETLIIRTNSICALANTNALTSTLIAGGTGYIYVPAALVDSYKAATNWSTYAAQFRAIEDYPNITGG